MNIRELNTKKRVRKARVRAKVVNGKRPRLHVFRSNKHIYAQVIDDNKATTVVSASDHEVTKKGTKSDKAVEVGRIIAGKAKQKKVTLVSFDRGNYKFAGRVKKLAETARENGLEF
jgi:large subunit ribosomal protein L18